MSAGLAKMRVLADVHCQNNFRPIDKLNEPKSSLAAFVRLKTLM
jgi:hypothetical protein